jgi:hypothetical protein
MPWTYLDPSGFTFTVSFDTTNMTVTGTYDLPGATSGTIQGTGCRLN